MRVIADILPAEMQETDISQICGEQPNDADDVLSVIGTDEPHSACYNSHHTVDWSQISEGKNWSDDLAIKDTWNSSSAKSNYNNHLSVKCFKIPSTVAVKSEVGNSSFPLGSLDLPADLLHFLLAVSFLAGVYIYVYYICVYFCGLINRF